MHQQPEQLHPELARQIGIQQERKTYDVHPSLQIEQEYGQEAAEESVGTTETVVEALPTAPVVQETRAVQEDPRERDWRAVRAKADEAKQVAREKEQLEREIAFYKEQVSRKQYNKPEEDEEDYRTDTEKQLQAEMEELKRLVSQQAKDNHLAKQQAASARAEQRLVQDYPDIREVVSDDNIKRLEFDYPHLYNSVIASSDIYTVGSAAYEMIMAKGIYKKTASNVLNNLSSLNISRNSSKPRSASSVSPQAGETPISKASNFMGNSISSEEERKALYAEMVNASSHKSY